MNRNVSARQMRLFNPLSVPRKQPHQMGLEEFGNRRGVMWHASSEKDFMGIRYDATRHKQSTGQWPSEGFHVGTAKAAYDRGHQRGGALHPVEIDRSKMRNDPDYPGSDIGEGWGKEGLINTYYQNDFEDPGSTSAVVESPWAVKTYSDYVGAARARKGIPGGEADWRWENQKTSFSIKDLDVRRQDSGIEIEHHDPRQSPVTRFERKVYGRTASDGEQQFMLEGPASRAPRVREDLTLPVNKRQFR